jgi:microcin C transport system substrate-binding protein
MPESFWKNHKLSDPLTTPPLPAAPTASPTGAWGNMSSTRVKDYWAADLPVNRGRWNFDTFAMITTLTTTSPLKL